jgi:putative chitinase
MPKANAGKHSWQVSAYGEQADRIRLLLVARAAGEKSQSWWVINRIREAFVELYGDADPEQVMTQQINPPEEWENTMTITTDLLSEAVPDATEANIALYAPALDAACIQFSIDSPLRLAGFISQVAHESGSFCSVSENLNYSAEALLATFPSHFDEDSAADYARQPEKIANRVYANRMGNGDEASGDGWAFRGGGLIQDTGRDNHQLCGDALGIDLINHPELLQTPQYAALSAAWFWSTHNLNALADAGDVEGMTREINGGLNGLADRQSRYATALAAFQS